MNFWTKTANSAGEGCSRVKHLDVVLHSLNCRRLPFCILIRKTSDSQWVLSYHFAKHTFLLFSDLLGNLHIKDLWIIQLNRCVTVFFCWCIHWGLAGAFALCRDISGTFGLLGTSTSSSTRHGWQHRSTRSRGFYRWPPETKRNKGRIFAQPLFSMDVQMLFWVWNVVSIGCIQWTFLSFEYNVLTCVERQNISFAQHRI